MKTMSFYNFKGGSGKTSFTILFASCLAYKYNKKVAVIDFDELSLARYRQAEISVFEKTHPNIPITKNPWEIINPDKEFITKAKKQNLPEYAYWVIQEFKKEKYKDIDIVLFDFPAHINNTEATQIMSAGYLGLCVVPFDKEYEQLIHGVATATSIAEARKKFSTVRTKVVGFINCIQTFTKKIEYIQVYKKIEKNEKANIDILPDMISFSERMKKLHGVDTMRTTISYPDWESPDFKGSKDLGLDNLFIDILKLLTDVPDIPGTSKSDFSFAKELVKNISMQSLNRQINGTKFKELEIELPEDMKYNFKKNY